MLRVAARPIPVRAVAGDSWLSQKPSSLRQVTAASRRREPAPHATGQWWLKAADHANGVGPLPLHDRPMQVGDVQPNIVGYMRRGEVERWGGQESVSPGARAYWAVGVWSGRRPR